MVVYLGLAYTINPTVMVDIVVLTIAVYGITPLTFIIVHYVFCRKTLRLSQIAKTMLAIVSVALGLMTIIAKLLMAFEIFGVITE